MDCKYFWRCRKLWRKIINNGHKLDDKFSKVVRKNCKGCEHNEVTTEGVNV